jgi:hypothetical protein
MDKEARLNGTTPAQHPEALRLWLRMLTCTQLIETQVRTHLRDQFETTLPRFDLMAQLERSVPGDRRAFRVKLTPKGREQFIEMAHQHEAWIVEAFGGLTEKEITTLHRLLGKVKAHTQTPLETA